MEKAVAVVLKFNTETFELDVDAPDLQLEFVLSLVDRARRMLEEQQKIVTAQAVSQAVRMAQIQGVKTIRLP